MNKNNDYLVVIGNDCIMNKIDIIFSKSPIIAKDKVLEIINIYNKTMIHLMEKTNNSEEVNESIHIVKGRVRPREPTVPWIWVGSPEFF